MIKLCVITSSRADYGLLRHLLKDILNSASIKLQLVVSGSHLSNADGMTIDEIAADGFDIAARLPIFNQAKNDQNEISKRISLAINGFTSTFQALTPDLILVLGDRYEIFSAAVSATISHIPIIHLHGGEVTEGAYDESFRHSITKMSHVHFAAAEEYRNRIIQLGENPNNVFCVGGLGVDAIMRSPILTREELSQTLNVEIRPTSLLVTYHPPTLENKEELDGTIQLLSALDDWDEATICFTMPNADENSFHIIEKIKCFVKYKKNAHIFTSLGQIKYYSCLRYFSAVIGNSSSGLLEAPTFKIPTVNIGNRQDGRLKSDSIIDCRPEKKDIQNAILLALSSRFKSTLENVKNPYGNVGAAQKILAIIESLEPKKLLQKKFYDL
jgi:GDP/UDP-N,N'-diacetylbacillosamine 2-epimerase (hydrolysing)